MIEIDGSHLEGGGQIVRTAVGLSAVTGRPVRINNIRANRARPGLMPQHVEGVRAAAELCSAATEGVEKRSSEAVFAPGTIEGGKKMTVDTGTAGALTLVLQTLVPICLFARSAVTLRLAGGTAVPFSPTIEYFQHVTCAYLKMMNCDIEVETRRHGFYPRGGGEVRAVIKPSSVAGIDVRERGAVGVIDALAVCAFSLKETRVAERLLNGFLTMMPSAKVKYKYFETASPGCFIRSYADCGPARLGADSLGKPGKRAEAVGREAALALDAELRGSACVDNWMTDQIVPYMALAAWQSGAASFIRVPGVSMHARTNIWVTEQFLPVKFTVRDDILSCAATGS